MSGDLGMRNAKCGFEKTSWYQIRGYIEIRLWAILKNQIRVTARVDQKTNLQSEIRNPKLKDAYVVLKTGLSLVPLKRIGF